MITIETFGENNRSKVIGNSIYKICQSDWSKTWYIHELYTNECGDFATAKDYFSTSLELVIKQFNKIDRERALTEKRACPVGKRDKL